jgi:hypothetical protein
VLPSVNLVPLGGEGADTVVGLGNRVDSAAAERLALDNKEAM